MEMKNKLFCHHKSKISLVMKRFSLTCLGALTVICSITIPTYISTLNNDKIVTEARETDDNKEANDSPSDVEEENDSSEEDNLLKYE